MYRNIFCFAVALMLLLMSSALAAPRDMTLEDASIAGISPGNDLMYVRSIYGEPDGEKTRKIGNYPSYLVDYYGQGFVITYDIIGVKRIHSFRPLRARTAHWLCHPGYVLE